MRNNIVLLGHGVGVKFVIESLRNNKNLEFDVTAVITHPLKDHAHDLEMQSKRAEVYGKYAYNVFDVNKDYNIPVFESENVNLPETVKIIESFNPTYVISIGCRNIIKQDFLEIFKGKVLNIHTTPLPKYRGAASDTWMILNGEWEKELYGCIHFIDVGIDTGNIISKSFYKIPKYSYPIDVFKIRMNTFKDLVINAINLLSQTKFEGEKQNINEATVFPRLYTPVDGKINWDYSGEEILKLIYGFGFPHEGASCFFEDKKINILKAEFYTDLNFHPFANGLIFGKDELNNYKVSVNDGYLLLKHIEISGQLIPQNKILKLGKKLS